MCRLRKRARTAGGLRLPRRFRRSDRSDRYGVRPLHPSEDPSAVRSGRSRLTRSALRVRTARVTLPSPKQKTRPANGESELLSNCI
jgi:hypothetical protein